MVGVLHPTGLGQQRAGQRPQSGGIEILIAEIAAR